MSHERNDEDQRRAYWTRQMEAAHDFVQEMMSYPVVECGEPLASLPDAVAASGVTVDFSSTLNSSRYERIYYLRQGLIEGFIGAAEAINDRGWTLKVEDGFRSPAMQKFGAMQEIVFDVVLEKVIWENNGKVPDGALMFRRLSAIAAKCPKVGTHMSGSAIDISVFSSEGSDEIDRGGSYIEISELTPIGSPFVSSVQRSHRDQIDAIMTRHGFVAYPYEFWHYSQGDAYTEHLNNTGLPARYGPVDFDPDTATITPMADPTRYLNTIEEIEKGIDAALNRRGLR